MKCASKICEKKIILALKNEFNVDMLTLTVDYTDVAKAKSEI